MSRWVAAFLWLGMCAPVLAQQSPADALSAVTIERARIDQERKREEARYGQEEAACYQRFAVNDCLREMRVRRRATFEDLRRQEIKLNDIERKSRGVEQLKRVDEKSSPQAEQEEADKRATAQQEYRERRVRVEKKQAELQADMNQKEKASEPPRTRASAPRTLSPESRAAEKKTFEEKQRQAMERRAQRDKALKEREGQPAHSLPKSP